VDEVKVSLDELVVDPAGPPVADQVAAAVHEAGAAEYADVIAAAVARAVAAATD
jgi:hypothetical protein